MKELLENYNNYLANIKAKEHQIKKLELEEISISGSNFSVNGDIRPKGYMSSNIEKKVINNQDKIAKLIKEIEVLETKINMINGEIDTLNSLQKKIIRMKFFDNIAINEICKKIDRTRSQYYSIYDKAIEKMDNHIGKI